MNHTRLAVALAITLLPTPAVAQQYNGNLTLASQSAVNAAAAYAGVTGNLTISGNDIVDLGPLAGFTQVGGYISMRGNPSLTKAIGVFPSLTDVGGGMFFYDNDSLLELSGFDALLRTGDNIDFWFHDVLQRVSGFRSLHTAGWSLEFGGNPELVEIPEFLSLRTIKSSLFILDNKKLGAISGFQALQSVSWSFQVVGNASLNTLCGLYTFFTSNNPYQGGGAFDIKNNGPALPNPTTEQDVINAGPCSIFRYGAGCAGTGGFVPLLSMSGTPARGQQVDLTLDNGLGGATSGTLFSAGQANTPFGGCTLLVANTPIGILNPLGGTGPGTGALLLPLTIPAGMPIGATVYLQSLVIDAGAPIGLSFSNGLRIVIQ